MGKPLIEVLESYLEPMFESPSDPAFLKWLVENPNWVINTLALNRRAEGDRNAQIILAVASGKTFIATAQEIGGVDSRRAAQIYKKFVISLFWHYQQQCQQLESSLAERAQCS